jgi:hypothetical protein
MDRLMASGEKKLTVKLLEELLGLPDRELIGTAARRASPGATLGEALKAADALLSLANVTDIVTKLGSGAGLAGRGASPKKA